MWKAILCTIGVTSLFGAQLDAPKGNPSEIRIVPVDATPEPDHVKLFLTFPESGKSYKNPVHVQMRLEGYPLGTESDFPRKHEIKDDSEGQALRIEIDDRESFPINIAITEALDDNDVYFDQTTEFDLPFHLDSGMHVIRVFPVRSFGESLKGDGCFVADSFYVYSGESDYDVDLRGPLLTYNEPQGSFRGGKPVLLDFYVTNADLSTDGYKVRVTIDGMTRVLTRWTPYYIHGLKRGPHDIRLQLLDPDNKVVSGSFNTVSRTFYVR